MSYTVVRRIASSRPRHATGVAAMRGSLRGSLARAHRCRQQAIRRLALGLGIPQELLHCRGSAWWDWTGHNL